MDDWGSEELSKLSMPTTSSNTEKNIENIASMSSKSPADSLRTFLNSKDIYANSNNNNSAKDDSDDSLENDGKEKTDATPENLKKIDDVILTSTTYCIGVDGSTNILKEKPKTTIEKTKSEHNSKNIADTSHNRNANFANEIRSSTKISTVKKRAGENKLVKNNNNDNFEVIKTGVEGELKIVEIDDMQSDNNKTTTLISTSPDDSPTKNEISLASSQNSFAFTIDFGNGPNSSNSNAEAKYKSLLERFQNRHKRGGSMSKLEITKTNPIEKENKKQNITSPNTTNINISISSSNVNKKQNLIQSNSSFSNANKSGKMSGDNTITEATKVRMRIRDRSTSGIRDPAKRHSWSPRSSTVEQDGVLVTINKSTSKPSKLVNKTNQVQSSDMTNRQSNFSKVSNKTTSAVKTSNFSSTNSLKSKEFTPRSTAMQMALEKIDFLCQQPPLDDFSNKGFQTCGSDDVSEAGTYTLDGDNYTEEQKELMNIDKSKLSQLQQHVLAYDIKALGSINRPTDLPIKNKISTFSNNISSFKENHKQRKNILEISYLHESAVDKPKISYLDKFKSRMKGKKSPEKLLDNSKISAPTSSPTGDMGTFTSITTSGVLAKKSSLDLKPKLTRKSSLTTSQIDSSEYVSASSLGCNVSESNGNSSSISNINKDMNTKNSQMSHSFTDHQKAEYRLNIFTNQTDSQLISTDYESVVTPDSPRSVDLKISDSALLKTAQSKNDWIQEWARNARARSVTSSIKPTDHHHYHRSKLGKNGSAGNALMTRSYNCDYLEENSVFSDNGGQGQAVIYCNKPIERFKSHAISDYGNEYSSSDPNVSRRSTGSPSPNVEPTLRTNYSRPPLSPSKIPSPLHSIGRNRSISKTRSSLQDLSPSGVIHQNQHTTEESDFYLPKTTAALSNLSRKNSLKSLNSSNQSPKRLGTAHHYSADEYSPPGHHLGNQNNILRGDSNIGLHRRNLSFDYRAQAFNNTNSKPNVVNNYMSQSYSNEMNNFSDYPTDFRLLRPRKNSFDSTSFRNHQQLFGNQLIGSSPIRQINSGTLNQQQSHRNQRNIDQTYSIKQNQINKRQMSQQQDLQQQNLSPLRRSSSFSVKPLSSSNTNIGSSRYTPIYKTVTPITAQKYVSAIATQQQKNINKNSLQKSASSTSFRKMYSDYDDAIAYYINDEDDLDYCSSEEFDEPYEQISANTPPTGNITTEPTEQPLTHTRYNKALLMRIERSKQKVSGNNGTKPAPGGVMACPNTPEFPRRSVQSANALQQQQRSGMRQSVPRDSSLNRLKGEVPNSLASAKKQILQTAAKATTNTSAQPRYLDISKYKPAQGATFLKKDESKSTLQKQSELKKSPSNATVTLSRADPTRTSNRSVKSVSSVNNRSLNSSNKNARDSSASKQKEIELEMWRRRAKYDPMRAAAEDKRKKEEAKKQSQPKSGESSTFLRSQSYHCGVVELSGNDPLNNRWTESSDEEGVYISSSTTTTN